MEEKERKFTIKHYDDIWLKNGLENYLFILHEICKGKPGLINMASEQDSFEYNVTDIKLFIKLLSEKIVSLRKQQLIVKEEDPKTKIKKEMKKDHVLIQEGKKIQGKVSLKESIYDSDPQKVEILLSEIFDSLSNSPKKNCIVCGNSFNKTIKKMQQAAYPFTTKIKSLNGIRTGNPIKLKEYNDDFCPHCYLLGILQWLDNTMIYRSIPRDKSFLILPDENSFIETATVKSNLRKSRILNNRSRWSNIKVNLDNDETENTPGKYSTLIAFLEKLIHEIDSKNFLDWQIISIPSGNVKNPKSQKIKLDQKIANVLSDLSNTNDILFYSDFVKEFYSFHNDVKNGLRDFDYEKTLRECLCKALTFDDFDQFTKCFLPSKGHHVGLTKEAYQDLEKILQLWRIEKMNIENKEEYIKQIRLAGITIANLVDSHIGLFFKMEKAKTLSEFLSVIQECSRRLIINKDKFVKTKEEYEKNKQKLRVYPYSMDYVVEELTRKSQETQFFKDTKNLLLIYSSLKTFKKNADNQEVTNEQ